MRLRKTSVRVESEFYWEKYNIFAVGVGILKRRYFKI